MDVAFNTWIDRACPAEPPYPPGWLEWWNEHRSRVQKTIGEAREQMGMQVEYAVLKSLQRSGQMHDPLAQEILAVIEKTYRAKAEAA